MPSKPLFTISPEQAQRLMKLSPEDREKVLTVAAKLMACRHKKILAARNNREKASPPSM